MKVIILLSMLFSISAFAQWQRSSNVCSAYTSCYDRYGRYTHSISCEVYGQTYVYGGSSQGSCEFKVQPYYSVECNGLQQVYVNNGYQSGYMWQWAHVARTCY